MGEMPVSNTLSATRARLALGFTCVILAAGQACDRSRRGPKPAGRSAPPATVAPFTLVDAVAPAAGLVRLRFSGPVDPDSLDVPAAVAIPGLPLLGMHLDPSGRDLVVETHFQLPQTYTVELGALRSHTGSNLDPLARTTSFVGQGPAARARTDRQPPASLSALQASGWQVVDMPRARYAAPSRWSVTTGTIHQRSNIYGPSNQQHPEVERAGTCLVRSSDALANGWIEATLRNGDDDGMGLVLRWLDSDSYCRFEWDRQRRRRRLVQVSGGVSRELAFDVAPYEQDTDYRVRLSAHGERLAAFVDGELVLSARLVSLAPAGAAGIWCWGSDDLTVRDVVIAPIDAPLPATVSSRPSPRPDAPVATHGVSSAEVSHESARLWVRASEPAQVHFEVATDASFIQPLTTPAIRVNGDSDCTAGVEIAGLQPKTRYLYRAVLTDPSASHRWNHSPVGRFTTAPWPQAPEEVRFAFSADFHHAVPDHLALLERVAARQPDFFLSLGDFPYSDSSPAAVSVEAYREKHQTIRSIDHVRRFLGQVPIFAVWDDHEVRNDWSGSTPRDRVAMGTRVWKEWFGHRPVPGAAGAIYRSFRWGRELEVFLLDTRFHRDRNSAADGPGKSMLGQEQKRWLLAGLSHSQATFKAIISSVPLRFGTTGNDHWRGFAHERGEIFDHIRNNGIGGVFFLSGDQHWAAVHHHAEGFVEVQACPLAAFLRTPSATSSPSVIFVRKTRSYGLVSIDPTTRSCRVELYDGDDRLMHTEPIPR